MQRFESHIVGMLVKWDFGLSDVLASSKVMLCRQEVTI